MKYRTKARLIVKKSERFLGLLLAFLVPGQLVALVPAVPVIAVPVLVVLV